MRQASKRIPDSAEKTVRDFRRATRRHHSAEEKIRIVLEGLRGEDSIAELCRKEGINQNLGARPACARDRSSVGTARQPRSARRISARPFALMLCDSVTQLQRMRFSIHTTPRTEAPSARASIRNDQREAMREIISGSAQRRPSVAAGGGGSPTACSLNGSGCGSGVAGGTSTGPFLRALTHVSIFFRIARFGFLAAASSDDRNSAKSCRNIQHAIWKMP